MRIGAMLPTFTADPSLVFEAARTAQDGSLDGVFAFDHLWPLGNPGRPALWSFGVLGAVAAAAEHLVLGPLVARIDLVPEDELVRMFATLAAVAGPERVIAAIGAGDRLSRAENEAYGIGQGPVVERLERVERVADRLRALGLITWIGGTSDATSHVAQGHADAHNLWAVTPEEVAARVRRDGNVPPKTWGGQVLIGRDDAELTALTARYGDRPGLVAGTVPDVAEHVMALAAAGVTWCVCSPLDYLDAPRRSFETLSLVAEAVK